MLNQKSLRIFNIFANKSLCFELIKPKANINSLILFSFCKTTKLPKQKLKKCFTKKIIY